MTTTTAAGALADVHAPRLLARVDSTALTSALADVNGPIGRVGNVPVLHGVKVSFRSDGLRLARTNYDAWTNARVDAEFADVGDVVVDARAFAGLVRSIGHGHTISLTLVPRAGKDWLRIAGDDVTYQLTSMPVAEFPIEPDDLGEHVATLTAAEIDLLARTVASASTDETLPILTGVRLSEVQGSLRACATDRYRLTEVNTLHPVPAGFTATVRAAALQYAARLARRDGDVTITRHTTASRAETLLPCGDVAFTVDDRRLRVALVSGDYPNVGALWPTDTTTRVEVDRAELARAVRRLMVVAPKKRNPVRFEVVGERLLLASDYGETEGVDAVTDIACTVTGPPMAIHLNPHLLIGGITAIDGDRAVLKMTAPTRPLVLEGVGGQLVRFLLMPVRKAR